MSERADAEAVGAMIPCADPKPPQIRKKIAQARVTVSARSAQPRRSRRRAIREAPQAQPKMERVKGKPIFTKRGFPLKISRKKIIKGF